MHLLKSKSQIKSTQLAGVGVRCGFQQFQYFASGSTFDYWFYQDHETAKPELVCNYVNIKISNYLAEALKQEHRALRDSKTCLCVQIWNVKYCRRECCINPYEVKPTFLYCIAIIVSLLFGEIWWNMCVILYTHTQTQTHTHTHTYRQTG